MPCRGLPRKDPIAIGRGGAVSSVDPYATEIGLKVLDSGGNAVDAAVATAAALGVTEPYSAGIGGGGFFVYYDASSRRVHTIDGGNRTEAMRVDSFVDPATGLPLPFSEAVTSGLSVGVPGTPATWELALDRWGSIDLKRALRPAARLGPPRIRCRRDLPAADGGQRRTLRRLHQYPGPVPPRRCAPRGRLSSAQSGSGAHIHLVGQARDGLSSTRGGSARRSSPR